MDRPTRGDTSSVKNDDQASAPGAAVYIGRASFRMIVEPGFDADGQVTAPPGLAQQAGATDSVRAGVDASASSGASVEVDPAIHVDVVVDAPEIPRLRIVPQLPEAIRPLHDAAFPDATETEQPRQWRSVVFGALAVALIGAGALALRARAVPRAASWAPAQETVVGAPAVAGSSPVPLSDVVVPSPASPPVSLPPFTPSRPPSAEVGPRARRPASVAARAHTTSKSRGTRARAARGSLRPSARSTAPGATVAAGGLKKRAKATQIDRAAD